MLQASIRVAARILRLLHACAVLHLQCGLARMPKNPSLLVVLASFMLEARADGQGARTQLQLAQKNNPSLIETYSIYACQQLAKKLQPREGFVCVMCCLAIRHYWVVTLLCMQRCQT